MLSHILIHIRLSPNGINYRLTLMKMMKEGKELVQEFQERKGRRSLHLPDFKSRKWLFGGDSEQSEALETGDRENIERYRQASNNNKGSGGQSSDDQRKQSFIDPRWIFASLSRKPNGKGDSSQAKGDSSPEKDPSPEESGKSVMERVRGGFADFVDWTLTSGHLHYALKLAIGAMLLSWPAFVPDFSNFFYHYRGRMYTLLKGHYPGRKLD